MATQTLSNDDIIEAIGSLSVVELAELIEKFKEKFGVTIAAPVAAAPAAAGAAGGAAGAAAAEEKTEFTVILKGAGEKKIQVIKEIRAITNLPEGGQGPGGRRARHGEGRRVQAGSRRDQKEARSAGRRRRTEVDTGTDAAGHRGPPPRLSGLLWSTTCADLAHTCSLVRAPRFTPDRRSGRGQRGLLHLPEVTT